MKAEGDRLDVLAALIDADEVTRFPLDPPDPVAAILFRLEQQGLPRKDLEPMIGSRARVAEVPNRRRKLSIERIRHLHAGLGISAEVPIRPTREAAAREGQSMSGGTAKRRPTAPVARRSADHAFG